MEQASTATLKPVTLWSRKNEKGEWEFNHLEDGHVPPATAKPTPKHENHKSAWKKGEWQYVYAHLTGDVPPRVVHS